MLRDSVVGRTRPRAIPLGMITIRKILHGFPFLSHDAYGAPPGGPLAPLLLTSNQMIFALYMGGERLFYYPSMHAVGIYCT